MPGQVVELTRLWTASACWAREAASYWARAAGAERCVVQRWAPLRLLCLLRAHKLPLRCALPPQFTHPHKVVSMIDYY